MAKVVTQRVHTPTVLQMEAVECGAVALGIVLGYHGRNVPLEELRVRCGVSRDGSKASNLIKAARCYGLEAKGFSKEPEALRSLPLPQIVFWNFNHFLVVEGFGKGQVYLNDPLSGHRQVTGQEFDQGFTGVVLLFEKGKNFQPGGEKPSSWATLYGRLQGSLDTVALALCATFFIALTGVVIPAFGRFFVDTILTGRMSGWLQPLLLGMTLTAVIRIAATWMQKYYLLRLEMRLRESSSETFLRHILQLPMEFFSQRHNGDISARISGADRVAGLVAGPLATHALNLLLILIYALFMFQYNISLALTGIGIALLTVACLKFVVRRRVDTQRRLLRERGKVTATVMDGLQLLETLKAAGSEDDFFTKWSGQFATVHNAEQRRGQELTCLHMVPPFFGALSGVAVLAIGSHRVTNGQMTPGMLVAFQSLMTSFLVPVSQLVSLGGAYQEAVGEMNRLDDVLHYSPDKTMLQDSVAPCAQTEIGEKLSGAVELSGITFGYSRLEPPLLTDFSLSVEPGRRVALVGGSGSGKSTLLKLMSGLYDPWDGEILLDGIRRSSIPREIMTASLSLVDQEMYLYGGSIRDSLTLWDSSVSEESIMMAARDACIHDIITSRPGGYDAPIGEAGRNFSGGELQLMEIARALTRNPSILLLDEATSALDPVTESLVENALRRRGCTCIMASHKLSAVRECDEIIVLDNGTVVERGTHEELMKSSGSYAELVRNN